MIYSKFLNLKNFFLDILTANQVKIINSKLTTSQPIINVPSSSSILTSVNIVPPSIPSIACFDLYKNCDKLAMHGYCESALNSLYMSKNCAKTCGKCTYSNTINQNIEKCIDDQILCSNWAALGLCKFYPFNQYMHSKCALSCNICK